MTDRRKAIANVGQSVFASGTRESRNAVSRRILLFHTHVLRPRLERLTDPCTTSRNVYALRSLSLDFHLAAHLFAIPALSMESAAIIFRFRVPVAVPGTTIRFPRLITGHSSPIIATSPLITLNPQSQPLRLLILLRYPVRKYLAIPIISSARFQQGTRMGLRLSG